MRRASTRGTTSALARAAVAALVLPLAVFAAACSDPAASSRPSPPPIRIGAIYNLSGDQAALDAPAMQGARLAVDRINAHGGLLGGRRVELLERDGHTSPADVRRAAASLVASGCSAIVGLSATDQVLAGASVAAGAGVPFVTSGATSPQLTVKVPNWLFLACFGDNAQAAAGAEYATNQLAARTALVVYDKDVPYSRQLARYFEHSFRTQGGRILASWDVKSVKELRAQLKNSGENEDGAGGGRAAGADVVFAAAVPDDAPALLQDLRRAGLRQPVLGGDSFDTPELIYTAEKTGGKVYYTTHAAVGLGSAGRAVRRFDTYYQSTYGLVPQNAFAALGYDAVGLVASAIRHAKSVKPSAVRDALLATHRYAGVTGTLSYVGGDRVPRKRITVVCISRRPMVVAQFTPSYVADP